MEEADVLASRAGILTEKMLAVGTSDDLRKRWDDGYYTTSILSLSPHRKHRGGNAQSEGLAPA